jgi:hypothetical protein
MILNEHRGIQMALTKELAPERKCFFGRHRRAFQIT